MIELRITDNTYEFYLEGILKDVIYSLTEATRKVKQYRNQGYSIKY